MKKLKWEYCECGCHGWSCNVGECNYSINANRLHGLGREIKIHIPGKESDDLIIEHLRKQYEPLKEFFEGEEL